MKLFPDYENDTLAGFEVSSNRQTLVNIGCGGVNIFTQLEDTSSTVSKKQPLINLNETATLAESAPPARKQGHQRKRCTLLNNIQLYLICGAFKLQITVCTEPTYYINIHSVL